jgi:beta-lactamase regulating signal transducer with metallopeptidase domain
MAELLGSPTVGRMGLTLLHFVWQGFAVMLVAGAALLALRRAAAPVRYAVLLALFAIMLASPAVTFALLPGPSAIVAAAGPATAPAPALLRGGRETITMHAEAPAHVAWWRPLAHPRLLVALWAAGVLALSLRLLTGWLGLGLARRRARPLSGEWPARLSQLATRLGVRRPVALLHSAHVAAPTLIGWLRPAVLLPAAAVAGLTTDQLEMVLAHELAHLRRSDYLVNLLQAMGETVLFYHPAVWWLSRRIRIEREFCCDDLAVRACGDVFGYAQVLTALGALPLPQPAVGGTGALSARVHRLLHLPAPRPRRRPPWMAGAVALVLLAALALSLQAPQVAHAAKQTVERAGLKQLAEAVTMYTAPPPAPAAPAPAPTPAEPGAAPAPAVPANPPAVQESAAKSALLPNQMLFLPISVLTRTFELKYITAGQVLYLLGGQPAAVRPGQGPAAPQTATRGKDKGSLGAPLPEGMALISAASPEAHSLLVAGTLKALDQFAEWLKLIDRKPQSVIIDVVEVETPVKALASESRELQFPRVVGSARMATTNLQPAATSTSTTAPVQIGESPSDRRTTTERLTVTPRINGDRTIVLTIEVLTETETGPGTSTASTAQATACVRDGEPFAMSAPGRGTIIVITPTIRPDE